MELTGYWMERGATPERMLALSREDRLIYRAIMELNREQEKKEMADTIYAAIVRFWNDVNRSS